jgi:NAD(P)-dependent dehydrogenase (short-subunit alcohol dehydrogenase family)
MSDADSYGLKGRTALITGAGGGLGRCHALLFAKHGANVVVNDLGGSASGEGAAATAADKVVAEIKAAGGNAVTNHDSVADPAGADNMVKTALDSFGSIDIVVNNAGILRDKSFVKMTDGDWDIIFEVHVKGAYLVTHAAWPHMRENKFGRVIVTASASGIYGNFGQSNYSAAKMALVGFGQTLALEGDKYNIKTNVIAPVAMSRMTEAIMPENVHEMLKPEFVSPLVVYLCSENCDANGEVYEVGAGNFARIETLRAEGLRIKPEGDTEITVDQVAEAWDKINDMSESSILRAIGESTMGSLKHWM